MHDRTELNIEVDFSNRVVDLVKEGIDVALRIGVLPDSTMIARKVAPVNHIASAGDLDLPAVSPA